MISRTINIRRSLAFLIDFDGAVHYYFRCSKRNCHFCDKCKKFKENLQGANTK